VAAGTGKSSTHPTQRHTTGPRHPRTGHTIRINDPRSTGLDDDADRGVAAGVTDVRHRALGAGSCSSPHWLSATGHRSQPLQVRRYSLRERLPGSR
jgi:hypothetical protein